MGDFREQWVKVDMEFFKEFAHLHNLVCFNKKTQSELNDFVLKNKEKFNNPDYLQIFAENVEVFNEDFYNENIEMCKIFFDFMESNPDWVKLDFGLRTAIRLGSFQDKFRDFLLESKE